MSKFEAIFPANVDSTMVSAFRSCHRKNYNEFILGLRPPGISVDLHAGGCFAKAIETIRRAVHVKGYDLPNALMAGQIAFEAEWGDFEIPPNKDTAKTKDRVWEAVDDYFRTYPPRTDHIQPFVANGKPTVEFSFAIPLEPITRTMAEGGWPAHPVTGEPIFYSGRLDMLGHQVNSGLIVGVDDKTGSTGFYTGWSEKWDLRSQFIGYTWALQQHGINCEHIAVRGIGILKTKIHHAEIIKPYSNHLRELWLEQLRRDLWKMVECWHTGYWDYNFGEACVAFGNCIFGQACQSPNADAWLSNFAVRRWNPLSADPTKEEVK